MRKHKILAGFFLLLSINLSAKNQTLILGKESAPINLNVGGKIDMAGYHVSKDDQGMGLKSLGGNLGITHYIGHDFEYGLNIFGSWATTISGKLYAQDGKRDGFKGGANLSARYMPKLSSSIRLGGLAGIGYSRLFGQAEKDFHDAFAFGEMNFDVGPSFMHQAAEMFSWGFGITYGMSDIRFGGKNAHDKFKQYSNLHTVRIPFDFLINATETVGVSLAFEPGFRNLGGDHKFYHGLFYDVFAGVTVGL